MITLKKGHTREEEIKKSRFVAFAVRVDSVDAAIEQIDRRSDPDASHNCWAYKIGDQYRFSDDGEPGGTAGRPILAAIEAQGLDCVLVLVTRFFGGIKLGAGGLARAYGGTAAKCLKDAPKREVEPEIEICVKAPFDAIGAVYPALEKLGAKKLGESYGEDGIEISLRIEHSAVDRLRAALADATKGKASLTKRE